MVSSARRIEELRTKAGLSRPALSEALHLPKMTVEKFETGRQTPNAEQIRKMAAFFKVSEEYIRGESSDPTTMDGWLSGDLPREPEPVKPAEPKKKIVATADDGRADSAAFNALLKSEAFRQVVRDAVLDVMKTEEGRKLIARVIKENR